MANTAYQTKTRIFKNAGRIILTKRLADGTKSTNPADIYTSDGAIIQSCTTKYATQSEKMEDGNSFFAAAEHVTGVDATCEIVMNTFDPKLWAFMTGATSATVTSNAYYRATDDYVIPENGSLALKASALKADSLILVRGVDGDDYTKVDSSPSTGQFSADYTTATLTFNADDKGKPVYVTCYKASTKITTNSIGRIPTQSAFCLELIGENCDKNETDVVADNFIVDTCKVSGDVSQPIRQKTYNSWTATFGIGTPSAGANAIDWVSAVPSERAADCTLSNLTIGSITLTPTFAAETTTYTASTSNATNTITATATDTNATVSILNGSTTVASGSAATWTTGANTVTVTVTNGTETKTYTITVTKT